MRLAGLPQDLCKGPVDSRISSARLFVGERSGVTDDAQNPAMLDLICLVFVETQPGDGTDGRRNEQEAIRVVTVGLFLQSPSEKCGDRNSRQIVVRQRGMTDVGRDQNLVGRFPGK